MALDIPTLTFAGGFITLASGMLLLVYWLGHRGEWAVLWWTAANSTFGAGIVLLSQHAGLPFLIASIITPMVLDLSAVLAFVAACVFNRHPVSRRYLVLLVAVGTAMKAGIALYDREQDAAAFGALIAASLYAMACYRFWRQRGDRLRARNPMIVILGLQSLAVFSLAAGFVAERDYSQIPHLGWFGAVHFVGLAYALGVTFFLISMHNQRREETYQTAAFTDPLTGLANRRAFMDRAQRVLDRAGTDVPVALLAFDLDRFKRINDTFGHATGDEILKIFADVFVRSLRPTDITARLGGEEFVAILPASSRKTAMAAAERIRVAFQDAADIVDTVRIGATVSGGVITNAGAKGHPGFGLADMLSAADIALYRAKDAGRNRIVVAGEVAGLVA